MSPTVTTHTPGLWKADRKDVRVDERGGLFIARCYAIPSEDAPERYDDERAANARLIAAAPELLKALRILLNTSECPCIAGACDETCTHEIARRAIAKAEGQ